MNKGWSCTFAQCCIAGLTACLCVTDGSAGVPGGRRSAVCSRAVAWETALPLLAPSWQQAPGSPQGVCTCVLNIIGCYTLLHFPRQRLSLVVECINFQWKMSIQNPVWSRPRLNPFLGNRPIEFSE